MLNIILFMLCTICAPDLQALAPPKAEVQASVDPKKISENQPIPGLIAITHDKLELVDVQSFRLEGKPLVVQLDREVEISPHSSLVVSFYKFWLAAQLAGLYVLPEIQVKVGGAIYSSIPSSYEVHKSKAEAPASSSQASKGAVQGYLRLDVNVTGTPILYPRQRFQVIYRFYYQGDIELTEEKLPLLDPSGFTKVGTKLTEDFQEGQYNVQQISQMLEAVQPGEYSIAPSLITGRAYTLDSRGRKLYQENALESSIPAKVLKVASFPAESKPPSFNEAIGPFDQFKVSLASPSKVHVGDKILLNVEIGGAGQISTVPLPDLCCQPGFSGVFQQSDLPPSEKLAEKNKQFLVEIRPLTTLATAIPSIEFSYFVPETGKYGVLKSAPIPIQVLPLAPLAVPVNKREEPSAAATSAPAEAEHIKAVQLPSIEIAGNVPLSYKDLQSLPGGSWWVFLLMPLGLIALAAEYKIKCYLLAKKSTPAAKNSQDLFTEAASKITSPSAFYEGMVQAFLLRLQEKGLITTAIYIPEQLPVEGVVGEVRDYLSTLERELFAEGKKDLRQDDVLKAHELFDKLN